MPLLSAALVLVLGLWAVVSVLVQIRRPWVRRIRRIDVLGLAPAWNFFAPRPIVADYLVSFRIWDDGGQEVQSWQPLPYPGVRLAADAVFNRRRRARKCQWGSADFLLGRIVPAADPLKRVATPSYLLLLGTATRRARAIPGANVIQFRIDCARGYYLGARRVLASFESEKHLV